MHGSNLQYGQKDDHYTINVAELFHSYYKFRFYHPYPNIYQVIYILQEIQTKNTLKMFNSISKQQINK